MRAWLLALALCAGCSSASAADVIRSLSVFQDHPNRFNCVVSNVTANTQCVGASGAGVSYYLTSVVLANGGTAQNLQVVSSTTAGNACATAPANVTPLLFGAVNTTMPGLQFAPGLKVTANSALCCTRSGTTAFSCLLDGYTAP